MLLIDFSRICLTDCRPIWQLPSLPCPTTFDQVLLEMGSWNCFIPPWRSSSVRFGDQVVVTVTTVKLSVDCICSGRIVLFAPVEHQLFVPITFFQLSHPDVSSNVQMFSVESSTVHCSYVSSSEKHNAVTKTISGHKNHIFSSKQGTVQINFKAKQGAEGCWN